MNYKKIIFPIFILVSLVQLYVPAKMILDREDILATGKEFRFRTRPIDPNDPFRGKFITLRFSENSVEVDKGEEWDRGETVYVLLAEDSDGYAQLVGASKEKPTTTSDFVKAKVKYFDNYSVASLRIEFPFERYYMEESKAFDAEQLTRRRMRVDSSQVVYAVVDVLDGESVLKDVMVNGERIEEVVKRIPDR